MSYASSVSHPSYNFSSNGVAAVDCEKQVRSWRLLRSLMEFIIPTCNCLNYRTNTHEEEEVHQTTRATAGEHQIIYNNLLSSLNSVITGTIFRYGRGKLNFCLQKNPRSTDPILLIEMAVPANVLAEEMSGGVLRIGLESVMIQTDNHNPRQYSSFDSNSSLLNLPLWVMYCNGKRVGYAVRRRPTEAHAAILRLMSSTVVGTGKLQMKEATNNNDDDDSNDNTREYCDSQVKYLRANFKRVRGSSDSESFHLIDPEGSIGQELSIFFYRSR